MEDAKWDIKVSSKGQITLPKRIRDIMMVREGDHLEAVIKGDSVVLTKKNDLSDSEQMRLFAARMLSELGYGDPASRVQIGARAVREKIPRLPVDLTSRIREEREKS